MRTFEVAEGKVISIEEELVKNFESCKQERLDKGTVLMYLFMKGKNPDSSSVEEMETAITKVLTEECISFGILTSEKVS